MKQVNQNNSEQIEQSESKHLFKCVYKVCLLPLQLTSISFNSLLNVCATGLPPCLVHDLFEEVVSFDLSLYIRHNVTVSK